MGCPCWIGTNGNSLCLSGYENHGKNPKGMLLKISPEKCQFFFLRIMGNPCCWRLQWKFAGRFEGRSRNDHLDLVQEELRAEFLSPRCVIKQQSIPGTPELPGWKFGSTAQILHGSQPKIWEVPRLGEVGIISAQGQEPPLDEPIPPQSSPLIHREAPALLQIHRDSSLPKHFIQISRAGEKKKKSKGVQTPPNPDRTPALRPPSAFLLLNPFPNI